MYFPSQKTIDNYADVLVNFALNGGKGIKKDEVVFLQVPESAKPLLISLYKTVLKSGAHPIIHYIPNELEKEFFGLATDDQLKFFPKYYLKGKIRQADHFLSIIAETNKHELEGIDPQKIMEKNKSLKPYFDWRNEKENRGKFTWTLGLWGTPAMASEAHLTLSQCWRQIVKACYLDHQNPVAKWRQTQLEIHKIKDKLNSLSIDSLHITSTNIDLTVGIGPGRRWVGCDGRNVPSFEIFISPDWRNTEGYVSFDQPLYRYGNLIKNIYLEFKQGRVVKAAASYGEKILKEMIKVENADKIGEFSLTDKRFSAINRFMAETLYDENFGGKNGNFHIALGASFKDTYPGKASQVTTKQWDDLGYNDSVVHTDLISTADRTVTAILSNGQKLVIYRHGRFIL